MSKEKSIKRGRGQPKKILDEAMLFKLASEDCTVAEISSVLGCNPDTIYVNYSETLRRGREQGNSSLKRKMFEIAMSGNVTMLVWLSKQRLGYKDKQPEEATQVHFNVFMNEVPK